MTPPAAGVPSHRVFHVAYSIGCEPDETPRLHQTRDGEAALELMGALGPQGHVYETALHFYPNFARPENNFTMLKPGDLLLLTTRPPIEKWLSDGRIPNARRLVPGGNDLESAIFRAIAPFFSVLSRYDIELSPAVAAWLNEKGKDFAVLEFTRHSHALITHRGRSGDKHAFGRLVSPKLRHTVGYFLKLHSIPRFPCGLLCSFAPGGVENLLFARLVRRLHSNWLTPGWQGFGFVRFSVPTAAEDTPLSAANFDDEVTGDVLAEHEFDTPPPHQS